MHRLLIIVISCLFCQNASASEGQSYVRDDIGEYSVFIKSNKSSTNRMKLIIDLEINVNLKPGNGFVYIPLPVSKTDEVQLIIEPTSSNNILLFGSFRPSNDITLCSILLSNDKATKLRLFIKNITVYAQPSGRSDSEISFTFLLQEAYNKYLQTGLPASKVPRLTSVDLEFDNFKESSPPSSPSNKYNRRVISDQTLDDVPQNIVLYLSKYQNETFLYWVLGIMGILIGYLGAPNIIKTPARAKFFTISGTLLLVGLVALFFGFLSKQQRTTDTTTIVTFGSVFGLIIGILSSSVQILFQSQDDARRQKKRKTFRGIKANHDSIDFDKPKEEPYEEPKEEPEEEPKEELEEKPK